MFGRFKLTRDARNTVLAFGIATPLAVWAMTAEGFQTVPSTPDIAVTGTGTTHVAVPGGPANYVFVKNDCATALYFDLNPPAVGQSGDNSYPLRLGQNQSFSAEIGVHTLGVSPAAGASACTFTVQFGR